MWKKCNNGTDSTILEVSLLDNTPNYLVIQKRSATKIAQIFLTMSSSYIPTEESIGFPMESKHFWEYSSTLSLMLNNEFPDCISMQAHSLCWRFLFPLYPNKVILPICAKHQFILVKIALDLVSRVFKFSEYFFTYL